MEKCIRCLIKEDKVKLFEAIYEGRFSYICERCSIIENISIIKIPDNMQIKESEKGMGVYERMRRITGMKETKTEKPFLRNERLKELEEKPWLESPEKKQLKLIDYFYWEIMRNRRKKGLSQRLLAEAIKEPVEAIEMLEKSIMPLNAERIIKKLESFFRMNLRKTSESEKILKILKKNIGPVLFDESGNRLEKIPEPKTSEEGLEEGLEDTGTGIAEDETGEFDIQKSDLNKITVGDLKIFHKKRIDATKEEKREEQKKIEERQKLIEARKEEFRLLKEKKSKEIDNVLGGAELLDSGNSWNSEDEEMI